MSSWRYSAYADRLMPSPIRRLASMPRAADTISFGAGEPDSTLFPVAEIRECLDRILSDPVAAPQALQYGPSAGDPRLRDKIAAYMASKGIQCTREHVLLTNGSQQALHLIAGMLLESEDDVAVQAPTYPGALEIFVARGARIRALDALNDPGRPRPSLIYVMANFHNPTGASLDIADRQRVLDLADKLGSVVVEDDPYEVLRYEGDPLPSLLVMATSGSLIDQARCFYLGTFSKSIVPGLRIGWLVGPRALVARLALMKQTEDLQAGTLAQACLAEIFDLVSNHHAATLRDAYRRRRDTMLAALSNAKGNLATWTVPQGGFFLWLALPDEIDTGAMLETAARNGVTYVPGSAFFHDGRGTNRLRLSYSAAPPDRMAEGVRRLFDTIGSLGRRQTTKVGEG
jgi:DNA-binding transcriptional MocR family regulator